MIPVPCEILHFFLWIKRNYLFKQTSQVFETCEVLYKFREANSTPHLERRTTNNKPVWGSQTWAQRTVFSL